MIMILDFLELLSKVIICTGSLAVLGMICNSVVNSPAVDKVLNPPVKNYVYKQEELWEVPSYWTSWEKNV